MAMKFSTGKRDAPVWLHLYGVEGIGKSTFGAAAPDPVFVDVEQGSNEIDTSRVTFDAAGSRTLPTSLAEVLGALRSLRTEAHPYRTVVIDTLDALEALVWAQVCKENSFKTIEDFGYGKGYVIALNPWRQVIDEIVGLREKGYHVITLGHAVIKPFKNPEGEDFDRYIPKLHEKAGALIKERANAVLFTNWRNATRKDAQTKRVRGVTDAARMIYTRRTAAYDAKNRYNLPDEMPLSWASFAKSWKEQKPADPAALRASILEKIEKLPADTKTEAAGYLEKAAADAVKLAKLNDWINGKMPDDALPTKETPPPPSDSRAECVMIAAEVAAERKEAAAQAEPEPTGRHESEKPTAAEFAAIDDAVRKEKARAAAPDRSLEPGVDVPAMDAKAAEPPKAAPAPAPAAETPKEKIEREIGEAAEKCKTPTDLARLVLPFMKTAIDRKIWNPAEAEHMRKWYTDRAAVLKKMSEAKS